MDEQSLLIEIRNKDLSWPEEMSLLAKKKADRQQSKIFKKILNSSILLLLFMTTDSAVHSVKLPDRKYTESKMLSPLPPVLSPVKSSVDQPLSSGVSGCL